jgi:hypothetical protein
MRRATIGVDQPDVPLKVAVKGIEGDRLAIW